MNNAFENLNKFFEKIKSLNFWQRIFGWASLKNLSYDAYEEFKKLQQEIDNLSKNLNKTKQDIELLNKDIEQINEFKRKISNLETDVKNKDLDISGLNAKISSHQTEIKNLTTQLKNKTDELSDLKRNYENLNENFSRINIEVAGYKKTDEARRKEHDEKIASVISFQAIQEKKENERQALEKRKTEEYYERMKQTWANHESKVENSIRAICEAHIIEYIDKEKFPFKGKPDNTIKICDEYVIFDAKSPANDDLSNFNAYIKAQVDSVKKYFKEGNIKKEIFLVIPSNTVEVISEFTYNTSDYKVFIITPEVLEPIILSLKKIEEYKFVDELSPEDRDSICRIIGKLLSATKRKIQIDQFFTRHFVTLVTQSETTLPDEISKKVEEYEKAEILNTPQDRRGKLIATEKLHSESEKIQREAEAKEIIFPTALNNIKSLPLYKGDDKKHKS